MYLLSLYYKVSHGKMFVIWMLKLSSKEANFCNVACWMKIKEKQRKRYSPAEYGGECQPNMHFPDIIIGSWWKLDNFGNKYLNYIILLFFWVQEQIFLLYWYFLKQIKIKMLSFALTSFWIIRHKLCNSCLYALKTVLVSMVRGKTYRIWSCFRNKRGKERECSRERKRERERET